MRAAFVKSSLLVIALCLIVATSAVAYPPVEHPDPVDTTGSGSGGCNWCSQTHCGCAAPPDGYRLSSWSCSCSSLTCSQSCDYVPN